MTTDNSNLAKVIAVRDDLRANLLERDDAIDAALLALLTAEHMLLLGPPGTGKSMLVRGICKRVRGAAYFEHLLTRFSTPEEIFGPLSLSALERDEYRRVTTGTAVEAHVAFLDEVFKANSAILNALLGFMNERLFFEGGHSRSLPLLSLFGASNEMPEDAGLDALYDRFLLRVPIAYLADDDSIKNLFDLADCSPDAHIGLDELEAARVEASSVRFGDEARDAIIMIKHELESEGVFASDRRWKASSSLVRAKAWLDGATESTAEHCEALVDALWTEPSHRRIVERVVNKIANPLNLEAVELEDAAKDLYDQRPDVDHPQLTEALEPLLRQLIDIHSRLEQRVASAPDQRSARARQSLRRIEAWHRAVSQLALKSLSSLHEAPGVA